MTGSIRMTSKTPDTTEPEGKRAVGRPLKFESVEALDRKIGAYFGSCDPHMGKRMRQVKKADGTSYWDEEEYLTPQRPYTISGLARALDTSRETLLDYEDRPEFSDSIAR